VKYLQEHGIPVFRFPEHAAQAFAALYRYSRWLNRQQLAEFSLTHDQDRAAKVIQRCLEEGKTRLGEVDSRENPGLLRL